MESIYVLYRKAFLYWTERRDSEWQEAGSWGPFVVFLVVLFFYFNVAFLTGHQDYKGEEKEWRKEFGA